MSLLTKIMLDFPPNMNKGNCSLYAAESLQASNMSASTDAKWSSHRYAENHPSLSGYPSLASSSHDYDPGQCVQEVMVTRMMLFRFIYISVTIQICTFKPLGL